MKNLKIEIRAVPDEYGIRVLEYRVSQDLRYYKEHRWLWGLIKFGTVEKYSTDWIRPKVEFIRYRGTKSPSIGLSYIYFYDINKFSRFKSNCKTYNDLKEYIDHINDSVRSEFREIQKELFKKFKEIW